MRTAICAVATLALVLTTTASAQRGQRGASCDRACLPNIADTYLAALAARDPKRAPLSPNLEFTEQTQAMAPGDGLWKTASEISKTFRIPVPDPGGGQAGPATTARAS
jgi:hypothetical protein